MAGLNELFEEYLGPQTAAPTSPVMSKQAGVSAASEQKKNNLRGYRQGAIADVGLRTGSVSADYLLNPDSTLENDAIIRGREEYVGDASGDRTGWQGTTDTAVDIVNGAFQGVLGIGAVGGGLVDKITGNTDIGGAISGAATATNDFATGIQSDILNNRRQALAARGEITNEHNAALEQEEVASGTSPMMAKLRRVGRDFSRGITNLDSTTALSGTASGIGSLAVGGWIGKGLKIAGLGRAAMPTAIGALEGGGAYQQTVAEVQAMGHDQLLAGSTEYVELIQAGMDPDEARSKIANSAGLQAAAIQAPIGVATGALVSKFEASPFKVPTVRTGIGSIFRETLEEGVQSGAGQASSNYAIRENADRDRELIDKVGGATAEGAVYGMGTAGAVQLPGLPGALVMDTARGVKAIGKSAYGKLSERAKEFGAQIEENSPLSQTNLRAAFDELKGKITNPNFAADMRAAMAAKAATPEQAKSAGDYVDRIVEQMAMDPVTEAELESSPRIRELVGNSVDRFDALSRASDLIDDDDSSDQDKLDAGVYILNQLQKHDQLFQSDVAEAITLMDDDDDTLPQLRQLEGILNNIGQNPKVAGAVAKAMELADGITVEQIDTNPASLQTAAKIAELAPEKAKLDVVERVLFHADNGDIQLTSNSRKAIEATQALLQSEDEHTNTNAAIEASGAKVAKNPNIVSESIKRRGDNREEGFLSGRDHQTGILSAWHAGNKAEAKTRLNNLRKFAEHLQNKLAAINESLATGNGLEKDSAVRYKSLTAGGKKFMQSEKGVYVNPEVPNSVALAQQIESDAKAITSLANKLANIFGELGVDQLEEASLDESLKGNAREVAVKFRKDGWGPARRAGKPAANEQQARKPDPEAVVSAEAEPVEAAKPAVVEAEPEVEAEVEAKPQTRSERIKEVSDLLAQTKPGELQTIEAYPTELATEADEGLYRFGYRSSEGKLVTGKYVLDGDFIHSLDVGDKSNPVKLGGASTRAMFRKLFAAHKGVKTVQAFRTSGARSVNEEMWASLANGEVKFSRNDPRPVELPKAPVAEPAREVSPRETETKVEPVVEAKPAPEPVIEPEVEAVVEEKTLFERLHAVPGKMKNWFVESFTTAADVSRLAGDENPVQTVADALKSHGAWTAAIGGNHKGELTPKLAAAYGKFLGKFGQSVVSTLEERLQAVLKKSSKGKTFAEILTTGETEGRTPNLFADGKALNLVEKNEDGSFSYNDPLLKSAVLAGLQWALTADQTSSRKDDKAISDLLGIPESLIGRAEREFFNKGLPLVSAQRELAQMIKSFWGVKAKATALTGHADGILASMAAEMLHALKDAGLFTQEEATFAGKTYIQLEMVELPEVKDLEQLPNAIEQAVLVDPKELFFFGSPPKHKPQSQMRNKQAPLTRQQKLMVEREEAVPHRLNVPVAQLYTSLGGDNLVDLFGGGKFDPETTNRNHAQRLTSQNMTVTSALRTLRQMLDQLANQGLDPAETEIFYEYEVSKVGRLHMQGANNPQANKLMREVILPTMAEVDLTDPAKLTIFKLALGQHWGLKVDQLTHEQVEAEVDAMISGDLAPVLDMLAKWEQNNHMLSADEVALIKDNLGGTPAALHAALEYARYSNANEAGRKAFSTSTYIEADGKTDGPINALMHMASGLFTSKWIGMLEKGGLYLGSRSVTDGGQPMSLNAYVAKGGEAKVDLYGTASRAAEVDWAEKFSNADPLSKQQMAHLTDLMEELGGGIQFNDQGEIELTRSLLKNPVTIKIYGSGLGGIAGNIAQEMLSQVYESMSSGKKLSDKARVALKALTSTEVLTTKEGKIFLKETKPTLPKDASLKGYTFTNDQAKTLTSNVLSLLVKGPMVQGIDAAIGETNDSVVMLQKAVQIQSIFLARAFNDAVHTKLASKEAASDGLTYAEVDEIWGQVKHLSPLIDTGWQTFTTAASGKADLRDQQKIERIEASNRAEVAAAKMENREPKLERVPDAVDFGRSFTGNYRTPGTIQAPMNAGVRGIPMMIIGPGDGMMIQNFSTDSSRPNTLLVFDGINMGLNDIQSGSELVNKSVLDGWLDGNPLGDVSRSFNDFLANVDTSDISTSMKQELAEAIYGPGKTADEAGLDDILFYVSDLGPTIDTASKRIQARKNVLKKVRLSVDHMATAMAPHVNEGTVDLLGNTPDEIADQLNELLLEEEARLLGVPAKSVSEDISKDLANMGQLNEVSGARTANILELGATVRKMNIPADQKKMIDESVKALLGSDYQVTFGTLDQIHSDRAALGLPRLETGNKRVYGFQIPSEQRIYLVAGSSETLAHELIHAATLDKLVAYYSDPSSLSKEQQDAAQRIEAMMYEWIGTPSASLGSASAIAAHEAMVTTVEKYLTQDDMPSAVNEFMAWTLSNKALAESAKSKTLMGRIAKLSTDMIEAIKKLVWGRAKAPGVGSDLFSNLSFNTQVLMLAPPTMPQQMDRMILFHSSGPNVDPRLREVRINMARKAAMFINNRPGTVKSFQKDRFSTALGKASDVAKLFRDHGWSMTPEQNSTFEMMVAVMATDIELDANALSRAQQIYETLTETLTEEQFMADVGANDTFDRMQAQERLNALLGTYGTRKDAIGRSTLLPAFLGLAAVHPDFRAVLEKIKLEKRVSIKDGTADAFLEDFGIEAMDRLLKASSGQGKADNVQEAVDALTDRFAKNISEEENFVQQGWNASGRFVDVANQKVVDGMNWANDKAFDALDRLSQSTDKEGVRKLAELGKAMTSLLSEKNSEIVAGGVTSMMNTTPQIPLFFQEMWTEILGRTKSNALVYDMVKRVRSYVQQTRQQFREHQPKVIIKAFSRVLEDSEWAALTKGVARMDIASLAQNFAVKDVVRMLANPRAMAQLVTKLEGEIQSIDPNNWNLRQTKAKELASHMNGGKASGNLLRNATAVASLFGEIPAGIRKAMPPVSTDLVNKIDQLVTLYAYSSLDTNSKSAVEKLAKDEVNGMTYAISFLVGQRKTELEKAGAGGRAENNHYKGHVPVENDSGSSLIVSDDANSAQLQKMGFTRVADYEGSPAERGANKKGYYFTSVMGRAAFKQGIMQNVRKTVFGIDPHTGYTMDSTTAGVIEDPNEVAKIERLQRANGRGKEPLLPVYDGQGNLVAYERSIDRVQHARLKINTNLAEILGIWRGRQVEEHYADQFNQQLVTNLAAKWAEEKRDKAGEYIDLFSPAAQKDPVIRDAVRLFTPESQVMIREAFPDGKFMVRKDLVNDAIGYRAVSVGDSWTGTSRLNPEVQKVMQNVAMGIFGKEAFRKIVHAEKLYQTFVSDAKVTIVVKSVIVPVANIMSNVVHLAARGVPVLDILRGFPKKAAEVDAFLKGRLRRIQLESDLRVAEGNGDRARVQQIQAQVKSILDANRRLSVWPLIEAGELAAISDTGISHEDTLLSEGKLTEYMDALTNRLPPELQTVAKYGMVSRDTALFKGMQKAVEYGDFLAKAVLFDNLVKNQGKTPAYALTRITEEFVNYDRQPGRGRGYLEDMGVIWFWNFKLRSMKVALSVMRNNPLHAAITALLPLPDSIGSPLTDNMASVVFDGRLGYSMGVDQLLHAHALNPWVNLTT